jgi:Domain of unknown function (DUF4259)
MENAMGIWGPGTLENDTAVDWMYGLGEVADFSLIEGTLNRALACGDDGMLDAADAEEGIAAAEAVARLLGNFGVRGDTTRPMDDWVSWMPEKPSLELLTKAWRIVARVQQPPSELLELWTNSGKAEAWTRSLADLKLRLGA